MSGKALSLMLVVSMSTGLTLISRDKPLIAFSSNQPLQVSLTPSNLSENIFSDYEI